MFKRIALLAPWLVVCGGCHTATTPVPSDPNVALNQFLTAVKGKDIHGMSTVWGDEDNLEVNIVKPEEFRMRVTTLQIYLSNQAFKVLEGPNPIPGMQSRRAYKVLLQRKNCSFPVTLTVAQMHHGGWVVYGTDLTEVGNSAKLCRPDPADQVKP